MTRTVTKEDICLKRLGTADLMDEAPPSRSHRNS